MNTIQTYIPLRSQSCIPLTVKVTDDSALTPAPLSAIQRYKPASSSFNDEMISSWPKLEWEDRLWGSSASSFSHHICGTGLNWNTCPFQRNILSLIHLIFHDFPCTTCMAYLLHNLKSTRCDFSTKSIKGLILNFKLSDNTVSSIKSKGWKSNIDT